MFHASARTARRTGLRPVAALTALATAGLGLAATPAAATTNADGTVTVDILGITDYHGRLAADRSVGGAAVLAGAVAEARAANPDTLFVSSGDNVGASTFTSSSQNDEPTLSALNTMGLDVSALGNHEFDRGTDDLARINTSAQFPHVAANITGFENYGITDIAPHHVVTTDSGVRVGFVGVTTPTLSSLVSPGGISQLTISGMTEAATAQAAILKDGDDANGEADIVVVLAHDGVATADPSALQDGSDFAELVAAAQEAGTVDAVMGGHTHMAFLDQTGTHFWTTQAGNYSEFLTKLSFTYDPDTKQITASAAENLSLAWDGETPAFTPDAAMQEFVAQAQEQADEIGNQPIGAITTDITRSVQPDGSENRGGESTLSNYLADLHLAATADLGTDIALMNPGGVRADLRYAGDTTQNPANTDGVVTYKEAADVQPFANSLMTFTLTGEQLKAALEQQWQPEGASRPFLKLGTSANLTYVYDPAAPAGQRIVEIRIGGVPVTAQQQIKVAANSFLAEGGDNFTALGEGAGHADAGRIDLDEMVKAFEQADAPIAPPAAQRAVGLSAPQGLVAGTTATLEISSFAFAAAPDLAGDAVTVALGGTQVGTAQLDTTPSLASDETGRATVTFEVPAGTEGVQELVVTDGVTTVTTQALVAPATAPGAALLTLVDATDQEIFLGADGAGGQTVAVRNGNVFTIADDVTSEQPTFTTVTFGRAGDEAYFGDWDGDGTATPAVRRGSTFHVMNDPVSGVADVAFDFGRAGDQVVVGDWDGNGTDTFGVRRGNVVHLKNALAGGDADIAYSFGRAGDEAFAGDFDGDGADSVGLRRGNLAFLENARAGGDAAVAFSYGRADDVLLAADWSGTGTDTLAVRRGDLVFAKLTNEPGDADLVVQLQPAN